jgi:hypothetical protein
MELDEPAVGGPEFLVRDARLDAEDLVGIGAQGG